MKMQMVPHAGKIVEFNYANDEYQICLELDLGRFRSNQGMKWGAEYSTDNSCTFSSLWWRCLWCTDIQKYYVKLIVLCSDRHFKL